MVKRKKAKQHPGILRFKEDSTLYLPLRKNDFLLYCYYRGEQAEPDKAYYIADIWELQDGDRVTISNRPCDFPRWFEVHPTEVCGDLVYEIMAQLDGGYQPEDIMEGPNIWRARAGDRLIWVGASRTGYRSDSGMLHIIDFNSCAIVLGEPTNPKQKKAYEFGLLTKDWNKDQKIVKLRSAFGELMAMGIPKIYNPEWMLG